MESVCLHRTGQGGTHPWGILTLLHFIMSHGSECSTLIFIMTEDIKLHVWLLLILHNWHMTAICKKKESKGEFFNVVENLYPDSSLCVGHFINGLIKVIQFIKDINSPTAIGETIKNKFRPIKSKLQFYDFFLLMQDFFFHSHCYPSPICRWSFTSFVRVQHLF